MRIPDYLESFRLSPAALALLLPQEVDARLGRLPEASFVWTHRGMPRTALHETPAGVDELRGWAQACRDLSLRALLLLSADEAKPDDGALEALEALGVELLILTAGNVDDLDRDEPACPPLALRLMGPDEAAYVPYLLLSCGQAHDVWAACDSLAFWLDYGSALTRWNRVSSGTRWHQQMLDSVFAPGAAPREAVLLGAEQLHRCAAGEALDELLPSGSGFIGPDLRALEICKALPFVRDEYGQGRRAPVQVGRIPGLTLQFDPAQETQHRWHLGRLVRELLGQLQPRAQLSEAATFQPSEELGLFVVQDSAGLCPPGHPLGTARFEAGRLVLRLPRMPLTHVTRFSATLSGVREHLTARPLTVSATLDPIHHAHLALTDLTLELSAGSAELAFEEDLLTQVLVEADERRIVCELGI